MAYCDRPIVLASASPRRRELLGRFNVPFRVIPARGEEKAPAGLSPGELVRALAEHKAAEVAAGEPESVIVAADTVVEIDGEILGKPGTPERAAEMLRRLSGRTHRVWTGVCVRQGERVLSAAEETAVRFHPLTEEEIAAYVATGEPLDNYDNVMRAIEVLTADWGFGWSPKRITLSSIGVLPNLKRYLDESRCHLAISLHDPFAEERVTMMPVEKAWPLADVVRLIRQYDFSGQRRVSFEYIMFSGFNDSKRHADALIRLLRGLECRVNLIRFHKIPDFPYETSPAPVMEAFRDRLDAHGITCTIRASRGEDILAACGMLAGKHANK